MNPFSRSPPLDIKPLRNGYILIAAVITSVASLWFTLGFTENGAYWRAIPHALASGYIWLTLWWISIAFAAWGTLLLLCFLRHRSTSWRSLVVIVFGAVLPSLGLTLLQH